MNDRPRAEEQQRLEEGVRRDVEHPAQYAPAPQAMNIKPSCDTVE